MSFQDNGDNTATITGTPLDAHVDAGGTAITVQGVANGDTVQQSYTVTVTEVNDEPTLTATGATGTFTEGGLPLALFSSAAAADSDSQATQTFLSFVMTVTNVQDTEEYLVIDGSDCDITASATCVDNTAGSSMAAVVVLTGTTATVTVTADAGGIAEATLESILNGIAIRAKLSHHRLLSRHRRPPPLRTSPTVRPSSGSTQMGIRLHSPVHLAYLGCPSRTTVTTLQPSPVHL
jgi:hypothetical protein